ncbi:MAG: hypothetical protein EOP52_13680 [Sphingobacteriales bacterium]|nr:MAG: hypothetical protein EOP52_13680 [Sphingobacteriales bacterium]
MNPIKITFGLLFATTSLGNAWDGVDGATGDPVEIGKGNLVRYGQEIEFYDHATGETRNATVESIRSSGSGAEVEVYDHESGETRTLEME